ncbi:squalene-associated FAD-dependent desaturase [Thermomonospora echinospora]|uniref:Squalene-associated FAD-dependent desaturase n=1 Tax=Thermomonospora echinospora TaxID=1992 RepID=A0A1H5ZXI3_9ACTN|nr:hydroxysqualene dehydroxylase HpnE [Thermomonospora echinospora]SEG40911.1 squalene-associated FAD-dependent desaturase [Thermomonospora echinospora]
MSVVIVGGGLAGISAALALQEVGVPVTLVEARPRLGGATHSFHRRGLAVDNGQHVFLRCCTAYRGLLERLGTHHHVHVQDRFDVTVLRPGGVAGRLRRSRLPGPLHMLPALARYSALPVADRLRTVRAALALRRLDPGAPELDEISAGRWLAAHGQRERARRELWEPLLMAALNAGLDEAAMGAAGMVCRTALLGRRDAADIGVPALPLGDLHGAAALRRIEEGGGNVLLRARAEAVTADPKVVVNGTPLGADAVILAVPHEAAARLAGEETCPDRDRWPALGAAPIVNVHVIYDRPVLDLPFAAAVGSPVQWVFDRTAPSGLAEGQYLAVSLSAADRWIELSTAELRAVFVPELARLLPAARHARVLDLFVTRERRATFRQAPGSTAGRPGAATRTPGIFLAGAWTATGWPDTMEGAVRSGLTAARLVRRHLREVRQR